MAEGAKVLIMGPARRGGAGRPVRPSAFVF
jgi:hypothetical protein